MIDTAAPTKISNVNNKDCLKKTSGTREMAWSSIAQDSHLEDSGSIPWTHIVAINHLQLEF